MTGADLVRALEPDIPIYIGASNCYDASHRVIILRAKTASGKDWLSLLCAAHEVAHVTQHHRWPWAFRMLWLVPVKVALEIHAWTLARRTLRWQRSSLRCCEES